MLNWFRNWLLWHIGRAEMIELDRWRAGCTDYARWLCVDFPDASDTLDNLRRSVGSSEQFYDSIGWREFLRKRYAAAKGGSDADA